MSRDTYVIAPPTTQATRSTFSFGMPLAGFASAADRPGKQRKKIDKFILKVEAALFAHFGMQSSFFKSAYRSPATTVAAVRLEAPR